MSEFKVGEIAIVHGMKINTEDEGKEVEVLTELDLVDSVNTKSGAFSSTHRHLVQYPDGAQYFIMPKNLKKLPPKDNIGDWETLADTLNYDIRESIGETV